MNESLTKRSLSSLAPLLLFAVFTACILMVLLSGADIYRQIANRDQNSIEQRTAVQYLTTRLHQSDAEEMVLVSDTLYLREELNGRIYYTRIYVHDGMLRELFALEGLNFEPSAGTAILPLKDLAFTLQDCLLTIDITYKDGNTETLLIALRSHTASRKEAEDYEK